MELCADKLKEIDEIQEYNQIKMIKAFQNAGVRESYFNSSTGYGYDDFGRDALDRVYAYAFDAEDALVRHNFVSGTHALTVALFGILRPDDTALCVTGMPYDTRTLILILKLLTFCPTEQLTMWLLKGISLKNSLRWFISSVQGVTAYVLR